MKVLNVGLLLLVVFLLGCGPEAAKCVSGDKKSCPCEHGAPAATQTCRSDGTWGDCGCDSEAFKQPGDEKDILDNFDL